MNFFEMLHSAEIVFVHLYMCHLWHCLSSINHFLTWHETSLNWVRTRLVELTCDSICFGIKELFCVVSMIPSVPDLSSSDIICSFTNNKYLSAALLVVVI